jgi:hypothetical protein
MRSLTRRAGRLLALLALAVLGAGVGALSGAPSGVEEAAAHDTSQQHGQDYSAILSHHSRLDWCDRETDGNRVRAWYSYIKPGGGQSARPTDWDPNGSNSGCGHEDPLHCGVCTFISWQLCEENEGCTNWKGG